ncbi:MAG: TRAP transporter small permease subunit, partial [Spirochaetales bacterium]|nr:TRAP transporter small permease subunit [Spirochaetales bacterium]
MRKFYKKICQAEVVVSAVCLSVSCLLIFVAAIARSVDRPFNWSQDLSLFLFAWSVFLAADVALRKDKLVRMELLTNTLKPEISKIVTIINYVLILVFLVAMTYFSIKLCFISYRRVFQCLPRFSYTWVTASFPVGALLMIVTVVLKL